jgi:hypothetical protein
MGVQPYHRKTPQVFLVQNSILHAARRTIGPFLRIITPLIHHPYRRLYLIKSWYGVRLDLSSYERYLVDIPNGLKKVNPFLLREFGGFTLQSVYDLIGP